MRFFKWLFGSKPTPGTYLCGAYQKEILPSDIGRKTVRIRYHRLPDDIISFRTFHAVYTPKRVFE